MTFDYAPDTGYDIPFHDDEIYSNSNTQTLTADPFDDDFDADAAYERAQAMHDDEDDFEPLSGFDSDSEPSADDGDDDADDGSISSAAIAVYDDYVDELIDRQMTDVVEALNEDDFIDDVSSSIVRLMQARGFDAETAGIQTRNRIFADIEIGKIKAAVAKDSEFVSDDHDDDAPRASDDTGSDGAEKSSESAVKKAKTKSTYRPAYHALKKSRNDAALTPSDWVRLEDQRMAPEYPLAATVADMSSPGISRQSLAILHFAMATAYALETPSFELKTADLAAYLSTSTAAAKTALLKLVDAGATIAATGLKNGSEPTYIRLLDSVEQTGRGRLKVTLDDELYDEIKAPALYAPIDLQHIRSLKSLYALSLYPATRSLARFGARKIAGGSRARELSVSDFADLMHTKPASRRRLKPSDVERMLEASREANRLAGVSISLDIQSKTHASSMKDAGFTVVVSDNVQRAAEYRRRPSGSMRALLLKAPEGLFVSKQKMAFLLSALGFKRFDGSAARQLHSNWQSFLKRTGADTADAWDAFADETKAAGEMRSMSLKEIEDARRHWMTIADRPKAYRLSDDVAMLSDRSLAGHRKSAVERDLDAVPFLAEMEKRELSAAHVHEANVQASIEMAKDEQRYLARQAQSTSSCGTVAPF